MQGPLYDILQHIDKTTQKLEQKMQEKQEAAKNGWAGGLSTDIEFGGVLALRELRSFVEYKIREGE